MHGGDVALRPTGGRFCLDGLVLPNRTPSPGLVELKAAIAPVEVHIDLRAVPPTATVRNKHDMVDLGHLRFRWVVEDDGTPVADGELIAPPVSARREVTVDLPSEARSALRGTAAPAERWLTVRAQLRNDTAWAAAGHVVATGQAGMPRPEPVVRPGQRPRSEAGGLRLGDAEFDRRTGRLVRLGAVEVDGPVLDVLRAPTENDHGHASLNDDAAAWRAVGLDRLVHRTDAVEVAGDRLLVRGRSAPAAQGLGLRWVLDWSSVEVDGSTAWAVDVRVEPEGPWAHTPVGGHAVTLPRLGLRVGLPAAYAHATWFGRGPGESYRDSFAAALVGRHRQDVDAMQTPYVVPQENGNHVDTRWLELDGANLPALHVSGRTPTDVFDFTVRRWTSEALMRAERPYELGDSGRVWLNLDLGQQGLGSASCGPALPERYRVLPVPHAFGFVLSLR
jgi:beta-galactosidase